MQAPVIGQQGTSLGKDTPAIAPKSLTRRNMLRIAGGAGALAAFGAVGAGTARAFDQGVFSTGDGPAYAAWEDWQGDLGDGPLNLVRAAILSSNAHNSQPWLFRVGSNSVDLFADRTRGTGANDPLDRELFISLGCALENVTLAAGPNGFVATTQLFPGPNDADHIARIDLVPGNVAASALYDAIPHRHTNRAAYEDVSIAPETLSAMSDLNDAADVAIVWLTTPREKQAFANLTVSATEAFIADSSQSTDSYEWWRGDWDELQRRKDGLTLDATGLPVLTRSLGKMMPDVSRATSDRSWLKSTKDPQLSTAAAFGIVVALDHLASTQRVQVGQLYQRLHLWATANDLAMQPLNQTVERRDRELQTRIEPEIGNALAALIPETAWHAVMPFRIGYPKETPLKSPRRPAEDVVMS